MLRFMVAIFLVLHGLIHILGFLIFFRIVRSDEIPYSTKILSEKIEIGTVGIRIVGFVWLLVMIGFVVAGVALLFSPPWWADFTLFVTLISTVITILGWPGAKFGLFFNLILIAFLVLNTWTGWLP